MSSTPSIMSSSPTTFPATISRPNIAKRASSSSSSIRFLTGDVDVVIVEGLSHANVKLEAKRYKTTTFAGHLIDVIQLLEIPSWVDEDVSPEDIRIHKVSGSLTNAVFFVSCSSIPSIRTVLLRIYGPSSGSLISRPRELYTLHVLSSEYHIGPRVYGTFQNGRVEEYFDSQPLTPSELRDKTVSRWIGARMAELHSVDINHVEQDVPNVPAVEAQLWNIGARNNVISWLGPAREVLALPVVSNALRKDFDLFEFKNQWEKYMRWLVAVEEKEGASLRVFAHNDTQYGNLLRLTKIEPGIPEHRQIIVVDFEYASPNAAAFDIANHFHEWTADYHTATPHIPNPALYPTIEERMNFYSAYLDYLPSPFMPPSINSLERDVKLQILERQVRIWTPASHAMWAVWGLVQAREDLEGNMEEPEFNYIGYAKCRMEAFRTSLQQLGL